MDVWYGVRVTGPITPYALGFGAELQRMGFTTFSARAQLWLAAHLSRWLDEADVGLAALTPATVDAFLAARRSAGYTAYLTPKALVPLLGYLRELGVVPQPAITTPLTLVDVLLERYRSYLLVERGLKITVARGYVDLVRPFVAQQGVGSGDPDLEHLAAGEITSFMVSESHRLAPKTVQRLATALRSLLRFWYLDGVVAVSLTDAVPKVAHRQASLPRGLEPAQVDALLTSCALDTSAGLRDFAILTLLSRMGLRCGEVAGLQLDDLDWRHGEITVQGKGNRRDRLPLPIDVGQSVVGYLRAGRPADALDRCVFIRVKAPHRGLSAAGVTQAVAAAGRRAGLGTIYAHRLRHSAATSMLTAGAPLAEIGQVLRHRRLLSTAIYAKVDTEALRTLARPWPAGVS
jgi:site-specific recombinase XerD